MTKTTDNITDELRYLSGSERKNLADALTWANAAPLPRDVTRFETETVMWPCGEVRVHVIAHYENRNMLARSLLLNATVREAVKTLKAIAALS